MIAPVSKFDQSLLGRLTMLLRSDRISLALIAVVGDLIAIDARLNLWFSQDGKGNLAPH